MDFQLREEEARLSASLFKNRGKGAPYTLKNANSIIGTFVKNGKTYKRTRIKLGGGLNTYHKHISNKEREQRAKIRDFYAEKIGKDSDRYEEAVRNGIAGLKPEKFVTNEKTLCTKVKISKKGANEKQKKIERSYQKNLVDSNRTQTALLNDIYQWYCENVKQMNWRTFENRMKQTKFRTEIELKFKGRK